MKSKKQSDTAPQKHSEHQTDVIKAVSIAKSYGKKRAVVDVSIEVKTGQIVGLLGPNGAGKTTVFYMICGLIACDFGKISLNQCDITNLPMHARAKMGIGYLAQETSIFRGLSVEQNIQLVLEIAGMKKKYIKQKIEELLSELSIEHLARIDATSLSGGERRRLEIARCLATSPSFILLDEPFAGVDPVSVNEIMEIVDKLKKQNVGVLVTDHNVRETLELVDHVYVIYQGKVLASAEPESIMANENVRKVYLGTDFKR